jgi:hypothetical protein
MLLNYADQFPHRGWARGVFHNGVYLSSTEGRIQGIAAMKDEPDNERGMMRKSKRSFPWEEPSTGSSQEPGAEPDDIEEEIIDLEEVVEPRSDAIEENDELAFDVEILDTEAALNFRDLDRKTESEDEFLLEDDILKEFSFFQDLKTPPAPQQETEVLIEKGDDSVLALLLEGHTVFTEEAGSRAQETRMAEEKTTESAPGPFLPGSPGDAEKALSSTDGAAPREKKPDGDALPLAPPDEASVSLDDFIARIENKLVDTVREIVESRLPEIVRTVLREEIERLKDNQETET